MKRRKQLTAALLAISLLLSMSAPARAAGSIREDGLAGITGSVNAAVRLDYNQEWEELTERNLQAELRRGTVSLGTVSLTEQGATESGGYSFEVSARDKEGGTRIGSALPSALDLSITGLPQGKYTLCFTGTGYADYSVPFEIDSYSKYIEIGTGDGTFALGDFNGDGTVDETDRDLLGEALGSTQSADIDKYDLNGDGKIDIVDLACVNRSAHISAGEPIVLNTACLTIQLDEAQANQDLSDSGTEIVEGNFADIFRADAPAVRFARVERDEKPIVIPIPLVDPVSPADAEGDPLTLQIVTPANDAGTIREGSVLVEYDNEPPEEIPFSNTQPAGVHAIARTEGENVITINLGKRTAVKKVTITVTKTEGGEYAVVESIRFLQDIVPDDLTEPNREVKNLKATAGNESVNLTWDILPNVSGYEVRYWLKGQESTSRQLSVDVNKAQITGLDNLKTYCFTVTPTDGSWRGIECPPVEAAPQPSGAPSAPDMVTVRALDGQLALSWKEGKNAVYYEVYYTDKENAAVSEYQQFGGQISGTSVTVTGLTNGVTYYLYVVAGNSEGKSGPSRISTGTPVATDYSRPEGIPTEGLLDNSMIASVRLADSGNYDSGSYTADAPFKVENVIDGDFKTHWTASSNWSRNEHVIVTFTKAVDLSAAIWVPRLDGDYPSYLRAYSVRVWYEGEALDSAGHLLVPDPINGGVDNGGTGSDVHTWPNIPNYSTRIIDRFGILPFGPAKGIVQISLAVEQRDYYTVSLSELMFVEYDPDHCLPEDIDALFANELHTQLASGVTTEQIEALETRLEEESNYYVNISTLADELALARELLSTKTSSGLLVEGIQYRSSSDDTSKFKQSGSEFQPLGVAAKAKQEITIYATGIPEGGKVKVVATQYNAEADKWSAEVGTLVNGRNIFVIPTIGSGTNPERGGSLYLTYSGANPEQIKLHIRRAVDIPVLELSDWYSLEDDERYARIEAYVDELTQYVPKQNITDGNKTSKCLNVTEISMPSVLLSLPAAAVLNANGLDKESKVENLYQNVLAWEDLMHICETTQGIDETYDTEGGMTSRQNIRCMQMFEGAFMYAAGSHIGIGYGSCAGMTSGLPISKLGEGATANSLFGWGIAHEMGHNMDRLGRAEITNNIYSLMVQTYDGKKNTFTSRLEASNKYPDIFNRTAQGWPGASNDVFLQLGMYWQLHLAYADNYADPLGFYNEFYKAWKDGKYTNLGDKKPTDDERIALIASSVVKKDLTEFFTRWGMTLSEEVTNELAGYTEKETRAIWYLSDQSRRERLGGTPAAIGTVDARAVPGEKENCIQVEIDYNLTQGKLQGFEIIRDGKPVAFVVPEEGGTVTYNDMIGSGNHRTYEYTVKAYDILGNQVGGVVSAGQVRVAYDQVVDVSAYKMSRSGTTVTFTFDKSTPVSGLKLTGNNRPTEGEYTITVDASFTIGEDEKTTPVNKTVTARTGSFDQGNQAVDQKDSYLTYFQKPGASADDARIWAYDAEVVTVTGIPEEMADDDIRLISYAGDDVAFLEGGTVGCLSKAYRYGDGEDDVIAEGTLVIVGTFRGDPRFNIVKINGRFTKTTAEDGVEPTYVERFLDGYSLLFADIPEDNQVSDINNGMFIFVPNVQKEAELQETEQCSGVNLLPSLMQAVLTRTDTSGDAGSQRETAETLWIMTPGGTDLPLIVLESEGGTQ